MTGRFESYPITRHNDEIHRLGPNNKQREDNDSYWAALLLLARPVIWVVLDPHI